MTVVITKHPPATIECVTAFSKWYGFSVCEHMDIQTEIAWDHWQHAWHAAIADYDRQLAENPTLQAAWRIADEASRELIEGHGLRVDHVTISLDADEIASAPALEEAIDYLENRGLATRMDAPDEVLVIFDSEDESSIAKRIFDEAFSQPRDPRSAAYKDGVLRALQMRFREFDGMSTKRYVPGTAECDAYFAGADEGHRRASEYLKGETP